MKLLPHTLASLALICVTMADAELTIWQVEANPPGIDAGNEWLTLINTGVYATFYNYTIQVTHAHTSSYAIPTITLDRCEHHKITFAEQTIDNRNEAIRLVQNNITIHQTPIIQDTYNNNHFWTNPVVQTICESHPYIPEWISEFTQYYSNGLINTDEFTTTIQYLLDKNIINLGEPHTNNTSLVYGTVTKNVDGNTIHIDNTNIRIPLVDVEDSGNIQMPHAVLARLLCPVGSPAQYDIDDMQIQDRYNRTVALVYCNTELHLGEIMMGFGLGWIDEHWCGQSEFGYSDWTRGSCW